MSDFPTLRDRYAVSEASQQARIRDLSFNYATEVERQFDQALARANAVYAQFAALESFVTANAADYSAAERADMIAVRTKIRQAVADFANGTPGVSGATVG